MTTRAAPRLLPALDMLAGCALGLYNVCLLVYLLRWYGTRESPYTLLMRFLGPGDPLARALLTNAVSESSVYGHVVGMVHWALQYLLLQSRCGLFFRLYTLALDNRALFALVYAAAYWLQHRDAPFFDFGSPPIS